MARTMDRTLRRRVNVYILPSRAMVRLLPLLALLAGLLVCGCGPSVPDGAEARSWFDADLAKIESFDERVRQHIGVESIVTPIAEDDPAFLERGALRERSRARFRETGLPSLARELGALGAQVRTLDGENDTGVLAGAGTPAPPRKEGSVAAEDGEEIDGRKLGWGVYTVDADGGGTREVRGYEVYWEATVEGRTLGFRVYMPGG
jgi:hypothetical protein